MEQRLNRAERYRQQANRYAELAKTAELDYLGEFFRKTAVRYVLMAEDLERWNKPRTGRRPNDRLTSLNERADVFLQQRASRTRELFPAQRMWGPRAQIDDACHCNDEHHKPGGDYHRSAKGSAITGTISFYSEHSLESIRYIGQ
jgi:hypothetical protein